MEKWQLEAKEVITMVENIGFSEDGKKIVTEINGKHSSMLMDIEVIKMKKGDKIVIFLS